MKLQKDQFYIVRTDRAGVFFTQITERNGNSISLKNARKIYYWNRACAVEQIASDGVGSDSKLTVLVPEMIVEDPIQIIPCSERATENLKGQKEWKK